MDSLCTPVNIEHKYRLEKEAVISTFRQNSLSQGTRSGTVNAFMTMFSSDEVD